MRARRIYAFIAREAKMLLTDKATVFWTIAWPIIWIVMVAYVFAPMGEAGTVHVELGVVVEDNTTGYFNASLLVSVLENASYQGKPLFDVIVYNTTGELLDAVRNGEVDAGLVVPEGFARNISYGSARLEVYFNKAMPYTSSIAYSVLTVFLSRLSEQIAMAKVNYTLSFIEKYYGNATPEWWRNTGFNESFTVFLRNYYTGIAKPIEPVFHEIVPETLKNRARIIGWYTIGAIGMMFLYTGLSLGAGILVYERGNGVLKRILSTPVSEAELLLGKSLGGLVAMLFSALVALGAGIALGGEVAWNPFLPSHWVAAAMLVVAGLLSIGIGVVLSVTAKTPQAASGLGTSLGLLLAFTAGVWFPRSMLPEPLRLLADYFPVTWSLDVVREVLVYGKPLETVYWQVTGSLVALIAVYTVGALVYKRLIRRYAEE